MASNSNVDTVALKPERETRMITYQLESQLTPAELIDALHRSTLAD